MILKFSISVYLGQSYKPSTKILELYLDVP